MARHGSKRGRKQEAAIAALLSCSNLEEAALTAGISAVTLRRWLKIPEFVEAYREAKRSLLAQTLEQPLRTLPRAMAVLIEIMNDPNAPASCRISAASKIC